MRIIRDEVIWSSMIRKITAPAAGDPNLLRQLTSVINHHHPSSALPAMAAHIIPAAPAPMTTTSTCLIVAGMLLDMEAEELLKT